MTTKTQISRRIRSGPKPSAINTRRGLTIHQGLVDRRAAVQSNKPPCAVPECPRGATTKGYCNKHYMRMRRRGDTSDRYLLADGTVGYATAHRRVSRLRGKARDQACVDCAAPAAEWSYEGGDPNELPGGHGPFSHDPAFYVARCLRCHRKRDARHRLIPGGLCKQGHLLDAATLRTFTKPNGMPSRACRKCNAASAKRRRQRKADAAVGA